MAIQLQDNTARREYEFTVLIEQDEDGVYISRCPALPGCHSSGDTEEEALEMIKDAILLYIDCFRDEKLPIPHDVATTRVRVFA